MPATRFPEASFHRSVLRRALDGVGSRPLRALGAGLLLILVSALSARAATFVVTTEFDGNHGACTVSLCTLRDAVIAANANPGADIITLPAGSYTFTLTGVNEQAAATGDLDVTEDLTINGAGNGTTIIDGNASDRVFEVIGAVTLTLNGVTVFNGLTTSSTVKSGGCILAVAGNVVLNNSGVTECNAGGVSAPGGGIQAHNVTMTNSNVSNNTASGQGGGINAGSVTMTSSTVSGNLTSDQGGGIFATAAAIANSTISGNQSTGDQGGGLFLINGSSTITNSTITGNTSGDDGGGIYLNGSISSGNPALLSIGK
jgi:CSLREA domain-containing protein